MEIYYAFTNNNKQKPQSPDYFIFLPREEQTEEKRVVGVIYRNKGKKDSEYLKIILKNQKEETDVIFFGFKNNHDDQKADWDLFSPKNNDNEDRKPVGQMCEYIGRNDKEYFIVTIFDDEAEGDNDSGEIPF
jgi:hypothetical protein